MNIFIEPFRMLPAAGLLIIGLSIFAGRAHAQEPANVPNEPPVVVVAEPSPSPTPPTNGTEERKAETKAVGKAEAKDSEATADDESRKSSSNAWYIPPTPDERRKRYINSVIGPVALIRYTTVAGVLTARKAPSEWGGQWEGFARRFASNLGESAINNTVKFGLDELLEVDSRYYLSRNRRPIARARNAVFSVVTARNRQGKRVFGAPKIAGHVLSNVIGVEGWYPDRYSYKHGLKGAAISFAVDAGVNLFREFFWKK